MHPEEEAASFRMCGAIDILSEGPLVGDLTLTLKVTPVVPKHLVLVSPYIFLLKFTNASPLLQHTGLDRDYRTRKVALCRRTDDSTAEIKFDLVPRSVRWTWFHPLRENTEPKIG